MTNEHSSAVDSYLDQMAAAGGAGVAINPPATDQSGGHAVRPPPPRRKQVQVNVVAVQIDPAAKPAEVAAAVEAPIALVPTSDEYKRGWNDAIARVLEHARGML